MAFLQRGLLFIFGAKIPRLYNKPANITNFSLIKNLKTLANIQKNHQISPKFFHE